MEIEKILEELYGYSMHGIKLGLNNIKKLCEALGNPQDDYKIIHIAGTNGKGSTATTITQILIENGEKVGKYTSPHILKFNERISINNIDISDDDIAKYFMLIKEKLKKLEIQPTFFEVTTAIMFKYFSDQKVNYVVLETGMGGKYDATNICKDDIVVITNVSLDHTEFLGDSIYKIACEKAGIIKDCKQVVVADKNEEFLKAIYEQIKEPINVLEKYKDSTYELDYKNFITEIEIDGKKYEFSLFGDYQYKNFLVAYEVANILNIPKDIIKASVKKVFWQGRFEIFKREPLVVLDGAHNIAGMEELAKIIKKGYKKSDVIAITSILRDKNIEEMLEIENSFANTIILTSLDNTPRGLSEDELSKYITKNKKMQILDMEKAYEFAKNKNPKLIVVCGSFYTVSKFKEILL